MTLKEIHEDQIIDNNETEKPENIYLQGHKEKRRAIGQFTESIYFEITWKLYLKTVP